MIRVRKIDHVAIQVEDAAASAEFYTGLFGLPRLDARAMMDAPPGFLDELQARAGARARARGGFWVAVPGSQLHVVAAEPTQGVANPFGPHLAFEIEDFDEAKQTLEERKLAFIEAPEGPPFRQLWLADPSGNTIELWARRGAEPGPEERVQAALRADEALRRACDANDAVSAARFYAPEFTLNSPANRIQSRQETLEAIAAGMRQLDHDRTIEAAYASGDVVVIMGHESFVWEGTGTKLDGRRTARRFTDAWRLMDGEWRKFLRQATTVRPPKES